VQLDFNSSDSARLLQLAQVKLRPEEAFRLAENRSYNVRFLDYSFNLELRYNNVLYRKRL